MRGIGACECRADRVGVLDRKVDDAAMPLRIFRSDATVIADSRSQRDSTL